MKIIKILILFLFFTPLIYSQEKKITGKIIEIHHQNIEEIPGAILQWKNNPQKAVSSANGDFSIEYTSIPDTLIVSHIGFKKTLVIINEPIDSILIKLTHGSEEMKPVVVQGKSLGKSIDLMSTINIERIGEDELRKAACCNLSESFETNASVDVSITDAVSGAKKIQMLGLDGVYTQLQWENIPLVRGLSSSYGLTFTPGTWIESIQITKGTGPVVNGYESMAGLINLEFKKPCNKELFYLNTYVNIFGRAEINVHSSQELNDKWKTLTFLHFSDMIVEMDRNKDGFRDMPIGTSGAFLHRWAYDGKKYETRFGFKGSYEDRIGGQMGYKPNQTLSEPLWGVGLKSQNLEVFSKNGFFFDKRRQGSLGIIGQGKYQYIHNQFGNSSYEGTQKKFYLNSIYSDIIKNTNHTYKTGLSFIVDDYNEKFNDSLFIKTEIVPGAFFEYTYQALDKISLVAGLRADYHNMFGPFVVPRIHFKWNFNPKSALRLSAGRGLRVPNPYADNTSMMASNRIWMVSPDIQMEDAYNAGISLTQKFMINNQVSSVSVDYYYTHFRNQFVVDMDISPNEIHLYNTETTSFSHSFQIETSIKPTKTFEFRTAFKYFDVQAVFNQILQQRAFVPKYRMLFNLGYETRNKKWMYDLTANWVGMKRLPHTHQNPVEHQRPHQSTAYWVLNSQITYKRPRMSFYIGGENLLNIMQSNAIIAPNDPFGAYFDATQIWQPISGINIYAGMHFTIKKKEK